MFHANSKWTRKYINSLPDSAFLYIDKTECTSKRDGKSHPLSCRMFPYKDRQGRVDLPHLRNAIARAPQADLPPPVIQEVQRRGRRILAEHGGYERERMAANAVDSGIVLHATPYDINHSGFYFSSFEEFEDKFDEEFDKHGVEEYEIQFIDGSSIEAVIFDVMKVNQGNIEEYYEAVDDIVGDEDKELSFRALNELYPGDYAYIMRHIDDVRLFEGTPREYAEELVDDIIGMSDEWKETYFDYKAFGRDLSITGDDVANTEEEIENLRDSGDEDDEEEADRLQDWVDEVESWSDRKRGEEFIESIGGIDQINDPERYFDFDQLGRDLVIGGEVAEVRIDGVDYVITNAFEL